MELPYEMSHEERLEIESFIKENLQSPTLDGVKTLYILAGEQCEKAREALIEDYATSQSNQYGISPDEFCLRLSIFYGALLRFELRLIPKEQEDSEDQEVIVKNACHVNAETLRDYLGLDISDSNLYSLESMANYCASFLQSLNDEQLEEVEEEDIIAYKYICDEALRLGQWDYDIYSRFIPHIKTPEQEVELQSILENYISNCAYHHDRLGEIGETKTQLQNWSKTSKRLDVIHNLYTNLKIDDAQEARDHENIARGLSNGLTMA